jgi:hypothetical protein
LFIPLSEEAVKGYTEAEFVAWSSSLRQIGQYHGAGVFTGLGLRFPQIAQR